MMTEIRPLGQYMPTKFFTIPNTSDHLVNKMWRTSLSSLPLLLALSLSISNAAAQDIYKCVNAEGDVEYTHVAKSGCKKQEIKKPTKKAPTAKAADESTNDDPRYQKLSPSDYKASEINKKDY